MAAVQQASQVLAAQHAKIVQKEDDVDGFLTMIKHDLRTLPLFKRKKIMHNISGLILDAIEENEQVSTYHDMDNGTTVYKHFN